ncbi:MAG TPA: hypothetical protein VFE62_19495 [Gemmataceae bacterium]|nr:hypothetical protein [Gemmataceae bacterium]
MKEAVLCMVFVAICVAFAFAAVTSWAEAQNELKGKRVAILVADGFEQTELMEPKKALDAAGAKSKGERVER